VHRDPTALQKVVALANPKPRDVALDIATGAGHVALALAPHLTKVIAYDMTQPMLDEAARNADARGLTNVVTQKGTAENLLFADSTFDIVTVRHAPHHFSDVKLAVLEMARVAKVGGRVVIVDSYSPEDASLDRQWNEIEKLRDRSHVRNYRRSDWLVMLAGAGLRVTHEELDYCTEQGRPMDFADWTRRMGTPREAVEALRHLFQTASPALAELLRLQIGDQGISFCVPQISIAATRP
jgi:SAM-dependent methyltransferase